MAVDSSPGAETELTSRLASLMEAHRVPGLGLACLANGRLQASITLGVADVRSEQKVGASTVFEAASLSKPVSAYIALRLVDLGKLDLDLPLSRLVPAVFPDDGWSAAITARHVLAHTSGLPNVPTVEQPMGVHFEPGSRFSYSTAGFACLQSALEHIEHAPFGAIAMKHVFEPLGMHDSSFVWHSRFAHSFAMPHHDGAPLPTKFRPPAAGAGHSLITTAEDYARFVAAALDGRGLAPATAVQWFDALVKIPSDCADALEGPALTLHEDLAWSLGWGIETCSDAFFHWGSSQGARAFVLARRRDRSAVVMFANSSSGLRLAPDVVDVFVPGKHPALAWLARAVA